MHDHFPLPVVWHDASSWLTDHPENIRRLPAGATLPPPPHLYLGGSLPDVTDIYGRIPSGRLIVLGRAGSGKSMLTMRFVLDFLETRAPLDRVPVIFSVGSWDPETRPLRDWLIDQLVRDHPHLARRAPGGSTMAAALVDAALVLPVLDGFDEIAEGLRPTALEELNTTSLPLIMTSRSDEFARVVGADGFPLAGAAGIELGLGTTEEHLLSGLVPTVYRRRTTEPTAARRRQYRDPVSAERWLGYLAHHLHQLPFPREDLAWWQFGDSLRHSTRVMAVVVTAALSLAAPMWLVSLFFTSLALGEVLLLGGLMGLAAGLAFGLAYRVMTRFGGADFEPKRVRISYPADGLSEFLRRHTVQLSAQVLSGFMMGVACALALALLRGLDRGSETTNDMTVTGTLVSMLALGLLFGVGTGLVFASTTVLQRHVGIAYAATPSSLLALSRAAVVQQVLVLVSVLSLAIFLAGQLLADPLRSLFGLMHWSLSDGLSIGAAGGVGGTCAYSLSFTAWGRWLVLSRVWLPLTGKFPWDIHAFLDDARRLGIMRRTGAVYRFRHPTLREHFLRTALRDHSERSLRQATLQDRLQRLFRRPQVSYPPVRFLGDSLYTEHDTARSRRMAVALLLCCLAVFLTVGLLSMHDLLDNWSQHGRLLPGDTTAVVGSIIGIGGALGTLIGATLTAFARLVQARGQAHADRIRAEAELLRAEAEMHRARTGQIPGPAPTPETSPDSGSTPTAE
ncbi:NACHT domain-containing protein [Streptomyces sp. NPDC052164]|uniref:NACHT domain-containing protein n=1 Tax=Streptomyces sp. NPDC052164 TaxID=3155529 RepID=UPI003428955F